MTNQNVDKVRGIRKKIRVLRKHRCRSSQPAVEMVKDVRVIMNGLKTNSSSESSEIRRSETSDLMDMI